MVDRLHKTFPEFRNFVFVQFAAHSPCQLSLVDVAILVAYARKVVMVKCVTAKFNERNHLGSEFVQCLLHAKVEQVRGASFEVASLIQSC